MTDWFWPGLAWLQSLTAILPLLSAKFNPSVLCSLLCPPSPSPTSASCVHLSSATSTYCGFIFINADDLFQRKPVPSEFPFQLFIALHSIWIFFAYRCMLSPQHRGQDVTEKPLSWRKTTLLPEQAKPWHCCIFFPPLLCSLWHTYAPLFFPQWGVCSTNSGENGLGKSQKAKQIPREDK